MKYMGSKNRIAKHILPIMQKARKEGQVWVEPFVGGGNMIDKVDGERIGADSNEYVIQALKFIRDNAYKVPKNNLEFTEQDYKNIELDNPMYGFAKFAYSFGGKFRGGWGRDKQGIRDYVSEAYNNAIKQSLRIQGVTLTHSTYDNLNMPKNSLIYCDPPYANTTKYKDKFDHEVFWNWCKEMIDKGHTVFVSEYTAPDGWVSVWSKEIVSSLTKDTGAKKGVENLFMHESQLHLIKSRLRPFFKI